MAKRPSIRLAEIVEYFNMDVVYRSSDFEEVRVYASDVNRPGLQLVGYQEHFDSKRLQIFGRAETFFLADRTEEEREKAFSNLFALAFPAMILTQGQEYFPECIRCAQQADRTLLRMSITTSEMISQLVDYLNHALAPTITRHGVLVEVYGEGVLLVGDSGVGKSETAIELVKRGHRLVADDAVEMRRIFDAVYGTAPELTRHFVELRGIGIINVRHLFGVGAIRDSAQIELVVELEQWDETKVYDRLGLEDRYTEILGVRVPSIVMPVRPGRNLANIIEVAAMNNRQKRMGFNAAEEMLRRLDKYSEQEKNRKEQ
ncbi:MAG: HPr(Ser) kinase/phosphatase [Oscillospiraceae bacterium]